MLLTLAPVLVSAALVSPRPALLSKAGHAPRASEQLPFGDPLQLDVSPLASQYAADKFGMSAGVGLAALIAAAQPEAAFAKGGEYGIWEGRIVSLAHPAVMAVVYAASAYAAFTGWQWRQLREVGGQVVSLKKELKGPKAQVAAAQDKGETPSAALLSKVASLQSELDTLDATRKELAGSDLKAKHYQVGSVILGLGTAFAIEGPVNTFLRAQKLFPGPHLYAGAGVVVCWAMAASLVPLMGKGNDAARYGHMAFNVLALGLFTWQLVRPTRSLHCARLHAPLKIPGPRSPSVSLALICSEDSCSPFAEDSFL
jgi:hypothetical protein